MSTPFLNRACHLDGRASWLAVLAILMALAEPPAIAAAKEDKPTVLQLPERFAQVRTAGSGRFLMFHLKSQNKLAMVDLVKGEIVHNF